MSRSEISRAYWSSVNYLTDEKDWSHGLNESKSLHTLQSFVAGWMPYVASAQAVVFKMDGNGFERWRDGLAIERKGHFAGAEFAGEFGELLLPDELLRASILSKRLTVPLGTALIRMAEKSLP